MSPYCAVSAVKLQVHYHFNNMHKLVILFNKSFKSWEINYDSSESTNVKQLSDVRSAISLRTMVLNPGNETALNQMLFNIKLVLSCIYLYRYYFKRFIITRMLSFKFSGLDHFNFITQFI